MKLILKSVKHLILNLNDIIIKRKKFEMESLDDVILVMLAADYNNLGDVAITYAQKNFLQTVFPNKKVVEIDVKDTVKYYIDMKKKITKNTLITLIGGGNTGDHYELIERYRRFIIRNFKKNNNIIFPQTIDFSNSKYGKYSLKRSIKDYSKNSNLIISARESKSYEFYKENFINEVILIPDIVFSLEYKMKHKRSGIALMLRNDKEKTLNKENEKILVDKLKKLYDEIIISDTCVDNYENDKKYELLFNKINEIASKKIVITDRLHGMILCYITNTPCIVMPNSNHKITMTYYNWLKECNYIKLFEEFDLDNIEKTIKEFYDLKNINKSNILEEKVNEFKNILIKLNNRN